MPTPQAVASKAWDTATSYTKSWWSGLSLHDKIIAILVAVAVAFVGYQQIALSHARQSVDELKTQVATMATKQQIDALNKSISDVDARIDLVKQATDSARADAQTALQKVGKPFKSTGMKSSQIVEGFNNLSGK